MSHILVVDDDNDLSAVLEKWFTPEFQVVQALRVESALDACRRITPVALLVDYYLPDGTGVEALSKLRKMGVDAYAILMSCSTAPLVQPRDWETLRIFDTAIKPVHFSSLRRQLLSAIEIQTKEADLVTYLSEFYQRASKPASTLAAV